MTPAAPADHAVDETLPAAAEVDAHTPLGPPHWRRARRLRGRAATAPSRPVLAEGMLKLMLILLAFFVFLHSRSEPSLERSAPILDSLALRFAASLELSSGAAASATALQLDPATYFRRRLVGHLPISAGPVEVPGALLAFELDEAALFAFESSTIVRERLVLLHRLAQALGEHEAGLGSVLVVTTAWPDDDPLLVAARLRTLDAIFAGAPLDPDRLRLGLGRLPAGIWRFAIRLDHEHAA